MRALVFADRIGAELEPLSERTSVPLLPVVGKELLIYTIEDLVAAGVREIVVVSAPQGEQSGASALGDGERWGVGIRHVLSRGEERPSEVFARLNLSDAEAVMALRGDVLRSPHAGIFLEEAQNHASTYAWYAAGGDSRGAVILLRGGWESHNRLLDCLHWPDPAALPSDGRCESKLNSSFNAIDTLPAYHAANLDLLAGRFVDLAPSGRIVALGLHAGRQANVSPKSLKKGVAYVGMNSRVHPQAELVGEVVIANDVVVDRAATVRDSVILQRTYLGELVEVGNAIVADNYLMRVDTGAVIKITDAFLVGNLGSTEGRARMSVFDRFAGLVLLAASVPLWLLAAAAAALSDAGGLMTGQTLLGNRAASTVGDSAGQAFTAWHWNTRIPLLRNLPRLLAVAQGELRLVGVAPLTPEQSSSRSEDWQMVRDQAPVGLLGPTQLNLPEDAPLEERLLSDAFYAREHSIRKDLGYLIGALKMLFSATAWKPSA